MSSGADERRSAPRIDSRLRQWLISCAKTRSWEMSGAPSTDDGVCERANTASPREDEVIELFDLAITVLAEKTFNLPSNPRPLLAFLCP